MACDEIFDVAYDGGYFDKDEQGWHEIPIRVTRRGDVLDVEHGGGGSAYRLGRRYPWSGFVALEPVSGHGAWTLFSLEARRLVSRPPTLLRRERPRPPGSLDDPARLVHALEACAAGTRALHPDARIDAPRKADVVALLARPEPDLRLEVPAEPGPGVYLLAWRRGGPSVAGISTRTSAPVHTPFASVGLEARGSQDVTVGAPTLDAIEAAFQAAREALGWPLS